MENQPLGPPEIFFIKNTPPVQQNQKQRDIDPFQPHQLRNPGGKQPGAGGEGGNGKGNPIAGNDGKPPQTQGKIDQMGQKKTEEIPLHSENRQQQIQQNHVHGGGKNVVPDADFLLSQSFGHGVGDGIAVEEGNHQGVISQAIPGQIIVVQGSAQILCKEKNQSAEKHAVKHGGPQTFAHQIGNPFLAPGGIAPGKLGNQQLCQRVENAGGKHHQRKHHAADPPEGAEGIVHPGAQGQPLGHQQIFGGGNPGANHIRTGQGDGCLEKPAPDRESLPTDGTLPEAEPHQKNQSHTGADGAPQHHADAGALCVLPGPEQQCQHGNCHGAKLLRNLHNGQGSDAARGGEIPAHHPTEAGNGEKGGKDFQRRNGLRIPNPVRCQRWCTKIEQGGHGAAAKDAVQEAGGEHPAHILGTGLSQLLGG